MRQYLSGCPEIQGSQLCWHELGKEYTMVTWLIGREVVVLQEQMVLKDWECYGWALECEILVEMVLKYTVSYGDFVVAGLEGVS